MTDKKKTTIYLESELIELLKLRLPCSISSFVNQQARSYLYSSTKLEDLKNERTDLLARLKSLNMEIEALEKLQEANNNNETLKQQAMQTIKKIASNNANTISESRIRFVADKNGLSYEVLRAEVSKHLINISNVDYTENKTYDESNEYKPI